MADIVYIPGLQWPSLVKVNNVIEVFKHFCFFFLIYYFMHGLQVNSVLKSQRAMVTDSLFMLLIHQD